MLPDKPDSKKSRRQILYEIIFEADTPAGKYFDILLIGSILVSVIVVMLGSVNAISIVYGSYFYLIEWGFTILFSIEYLLRLYCVRNRFKYAVSFFGVVDLLAILPTYIGLILSGSHNMIVIRILRVLRVFRVLKLVSYIGESDLLLRALRASLRKILVFLFTVLTMVVIIGALMYIIEGHENGFTSIPRGIYWAIVTLTTVGYGDISPTTALGQTIASVVMILGYGIIAVPTGIVTVEMTQATKKINNTPSCSACDVQSHDSDAKFCKHCGAKLL